MGSEAPGLEGVEEQESPESRLIMTVELPALEIHTTLVCSLVLGEHGETVLQAVSALVEDTVEELGRHVQVFDPDGSMRTKTANLRSGSLRALEGWKEKLKNADRAVQRGEAAEQRCEAAEQSMRQLREGYYKEITMLREQLHIKQVAEKAGKAFKPDECALFETCCPGQDPRDSSPEKPGLQTMEELQADFEAQLSRYKSRMIKLNEALENAKYLLSRKDMLLQTVITKHGYTSEHDIVGSRRVSNGSEPEQNSPMQQTYSERIGNMTPFGGRSAGRAKRRSALSMAGSELGEVASSSGSSIFSSFKPMKKVRSMKQPSVGAVISGLKQFSRRFRRGGSLGRSSRTEEHPSMEEIEEGEEDDTIYNSGLLPHSEADATEGAETVAARECDSQTDLDGATVEAALEVLRARAHRRSSYDLGDEGAEQPTVEQLEQLLNLAQGDPQASPAAPDGCQEWETKADPWEALGWVKNAESSHNDLEAAVAEMGLIDEELAALPPSTASESSRAQELAGLPPSTASESSRAQAQAVLPGMPAPPLPQTPTSRRAGTRATMPNISKVGSMKRVGSEKAAPGPSSSSHKGKSFSSSHGQEGIASGQGFDESAHDNASAGLTVFNFSNNLASPGSPNAKLPKGRTLSNRR